MTSAAQNVLRWILEKYMANTRLCIIAGYTHKLSPALLSRCTSFCFSPLPTAALRRRVDHVIAAKGVPIGARRRRLAAQGVARRQVLVAQRFTACFASPTPIDEEGQPDPTKEREEITEDAIYDCIAAPHPDDIQQMLQTLLKSDIATSLLTIHDIKTKKGLALADTLSALIKELCRLEVPKQTRGADQGLAEIEWRVGSGGGETGGLAGVVRQGVAVMKNRNRLFLSVCQILGSTYIWGRAMDRMLQCLPPIDVISLSTTLLPSTSR